MSNLTTKEGVENLKAEIEQGERMLEYHRREVQKWLDFIAAHEDLMELLKPKKGSKNANFKTNG